MIGEPDLKILVLSDSHRAIGAMYDAAMLEDPDAIMHLETMSRTRRSFPTRSI